jgi:hypothetical protein
MERGERGDKPDKPLADLIAEALNAILEDAVRQGIITPEQRTAIIRRQEIGF